MTEFLLDTNIVSQIFRNNPFVLQRLKETQPSQIYISSITAGELHYVIAKRPDATRLKTSVLLFLRSIQVLDWNKKDAEVYGHLRAEMQLTGKNLEALDMLIAAHAIAKEKILVTNDKAFQHVKGLTIEDWTLPH